MKKFLWFLIPFVLAFAAGYYYLVSNIKTSPLPLKTPSPSQLPSPSSIFENPPPESLKGQIVSKTGDVNWQSRTATESAKLEDLKPVLQGEEFETGDNGRLSILFTNVLSVALSPKSKITFAQTLPQNLVLVQNDGIIYYKQEGTSIISIRALSLLIRENSAEVKVVVDSDNKTVLVTVVSGSISAAYEDLNQNSHLVSAKVDQKLSFDETTRISEVK